jgi:presequence protease
VAYPYDAGGEQESVKTFVTLNWLLTGPGNPELTLGLSILAHILIGTPASPLRKTLIESGLGEDLTGRGLDSDLPEMIFSTGLKGVDQKDTQKWSSLSCLPSRTWLRRGSIPIRWRPL